MSQGQNDRAVDAGCDEFPEAFESDALCQRCPTSRTEHEFLGVVANMRANSGNDQLLRWLTTSEPSHIGTQTCDGRSPTPRRDPSSNVGRAHDEAERKTGSNSESYGQEGKGHEAPSSM